jgi:two-component system response regulator PrrA
VLVTEDDEAVRVALQRGLTLHGFDVDAVVDAEQALDHIGRRRPDVLVADVGLPGMSGIDLCTRLRALDVDLPILILSARDQVTDRVAGLAAGADDYLIKPFDLDELTLRLRALLRRARSSPHGATSTLAAGPLWIDLDRRVAHVDGKPLALSRREFDLLATLTSNAGIVLSRIRLLEIVWG